MARYKPSPIFESFSGKIGNSVFTSNRAGNCLRNHVVPSNPQTANQVAIREIFKEVAAKWFSLSASQRSLWTNFANAGYIPLQRDPNTLGYTGRQAFSALQTAAQFAMDMEDTLGIIAGTGVNIGGDDVTISSSQIAGLITDAPAIWNPSMNFEIDGGTSLLTDFSLAQGLLQNDAGTFTINMDFDSVSHAGTDCSIKNGGQVVGFAIYLSNALKADGQSVISPYQKKYIITPGIIAGTHNHVGVADRVAFTYTWEEGDFGYLSGWYYVTLVMYNGNGEQYPLKAKYVEFTIPT